MRADPVGAEPVELVDGIIVGLTDPVPGEIWDAFATVVIVSPDGTRTEVDSPNPISSIHATASPAVALVRFDELAFGGPAALFNARTGAFFDLGDSAGVLDAQLFQGSYGQPSTVSMSVDVERATDRPPRHLRIDTSTWAVEDLGECRATLLSPDSSWLVDRPAVDRDGCRGREESRLSVRPASSGEWRAVSFDRAVGRIRAEVGWMSPASPFMVAVAFDQQDRRERLFVVDLERAQATSAGHPALPIVWVNAEVVAVHLGGAVDLLDVRTARRQPIIDAASSLGGKWCASRAQPGVLVEWQQIGAGVTFRFVDVSGVELGRATANVRPPEWCGKLGFPVTGWGQWLWEVAGSPAHGLDLYAINPRDQRVVSFADEVGGAFVPSAFAEGPEGLAAVSVLGGLRASAGWMLDANLGTATPLPGEGWDRADFSPSGRYLLAWRRDDNLTGTGGAATVRMLDGQVVRTVDDVVQPVWLRG